MTEPLFAAAASQHPDPASAAAEAIGAIAEALPAPPTLALILVDDRFASVMGSIARLASGALACDHVVVGSSVGVVGRSSAPKLQSASMSIWTTTIPTRVANARFQMVQGPEQAAPVAVLAGLPAHVDQASTAIVLCRPGVPYPVVVEEFNARYTNIRLTGGVPQTAATQPLRVIDPFTADDEPAAPDVVAMFLPPEMASAVTVSAVATPTLSALGDALRITQAVSGLVFLSAVQATSPTFDGVTDEREEPPTDGVAKFSELLSELTDTGTGFGDGLEGLDADEDHEPMAHGVGMAAAVAGCYTAVEFAPFAVTDFGADGAPPDSQDADEHGVMNAANMLSASVLSLEPGTSP